MPVRAAISAVVVFVPVAGSAEAAPQPRDVTVVEHVGTALPRDLQFTDDAGRTVSLGSLLDGVPLVLTLGYFSCPMLCPLSLEATADAFRESGWTLGRDYRAVTVSIDPRDGPEAAHDWRARAAARLGADPARIDWRFLVSGGDAARNLADRVGFQYAYDAAAGQYSHPAALIVIGADGRVSRYVYGLTYSGSDLADALAGARDNRRISSVGAFILRCFHYVPAARAHGGAVVWMLRTCGALVSATIAATLFVLWRREHA